MVRTRNGLYRITPPKIQVRNTIGCGDCFLSGLIYGIHQGLDTEDTLRIATAISAATAESALSVGYDTSRAEELKKNVTIVKLH